MKEIKVFIAGSKKLQVERDAIRASLMELSNKNIDKGVLIRTYTFEDFSRSFVEGGRQQEYNQFIAEKADYVIFVFDNTVGGITLSEFNVAMDSFISKGKPFIFVYCNSVNVTDSFEDIVRRINECQQYYIEYSDIMSLKLQVKADFNEILTVNYPSQSKSQSIPLNDKAKYAVELGANMHLFIFAAMIGSLEEQIGTYEGIVKSCNIFEINPPISKPIPIVPEEKEVKVVVHRPTYKEVYTLLTDVSTAHEAMKEMQSLADNGDSDAAYLLSRLYFSSKRADDYESQDVKTIKANLNLASDNVKAHQYLKMAVRNDDKNYKALYELGCDYLGGAGRTDAVSRNIGLADSCFQMALRYAQNDHLYKEMINAQIKKYNK